MKKIILILITTITFSCNSQTKEQKVESERNELKSQVEKTKSNNNSDIQKTVNKNTLGKITQEYVGNEKKVVIKQVKLTDETFYWEVVINKKLFLAILKTADYKNETYSNLELFELKGSSLIGNYIKYYLHEKNN
ncbi:hypothetical protein [Psychroserpens sp. S379A]|uniref:hypothetical protein n=1 Tax=Psychroserpens sp. S379A TaxID=3415137 RepID=UPI003C7A103B